jgi:NAD-dependent SIR2 family protein deacetylase
MTFARLTLSPFVLQPDITFFGEELDDRFERRLFADRESVECVLPTLT